jgi:O-antigen/teichoic acid export membrane protein
MTPFLLAPFVAQNLASFIALATALRLLQWRTPHLRSLFRSVGSNVHREIRHTALPMMLITVGLPVALQTDRLVLSHVSTRTELSHYAIVAMLYVPAWSIISSAGMSLWPKFAGMGRRTDEERVLSYQRAFRVFAFAGGAGGVALVALGPIVTRQWAGSDGGRWTLWCAFGILLWVQAAHLPGGMFLTQPSGLRFQAICVTTMCVVNVPVSVALAQPFGAVGPVLASAITILGFQLLTARRYILRRDAPDLGNPSGRSGVLRRTTRQNEPASGEARSW